MNSKWSVKYVIWSPLADLWDQWDQRLNLCQSCYIWLHGHLLDWSGLNGFSSYLACHVQWKNEKWVINLSHVTRTFSPLYFFFHFSCISIIISIIYFSGSQEKHLPSTMLLPSEKIPVPFTEFMMSNRSSHAYRDYCEFKWSACYFSSQTSVSSGMRWMSSL